MAMGVGDAGSRLSLCGAPFVDYKVRAVSYSSGGCVSIFCQTLFLSTELCQQFSLTACGHGLATSQHCHYWCLGKEKDIDVV